MRKFLVLCFMLLMGVLVLAACGDAESDGEATSDGEESGTGKHAIIFKSTGNPFGEKLMEGFENAIEEAGGEAILRAPDSPTVEGQVQIIEELITQQVDSIVISGNDEDALEPVLKKAIDQGIKVVSTDSAVNADSRMDNVNQTNPEGVGRVQYESVAEMMVYDVDY